MKLINLIMTLFLAFYSCVTFGQPTAQFTLNTTDHTVSCLPGNENKVFCGGPSLTSNIIISCGNGTGAVMASCDKILTDIPPQGVKNFAPCYQTSDTSGDAACSFNSMVYPKNSLSFVVAGDTSDGYAVPANVNLVTSDNTSASLSGLLALSSPADTVSNANTAPTPVTVTIALDACSATVPALGISNPFDLTTAAVSSPLAEMASTVVVNVTKPTTTTVGITSTISASTTVVVLTQPTTTTVSLSSSMLGSSSTNVVSVAKSMKTVKSVTSSTMESLNNTSSPAIVSLTQPKTTTTGGATTSSFESFATASAKATATVEADFNSTSSHNFTLGANTTNTLGTQPFTGNAGLGKSGGRAVGSMFYLVVALLALAI